MLRARSSFGGALCGRGDYLDVTGQWRNFKASSLVCSAMLAITFKGLHEIEGGKTIAEKSSNPFGISHSLPEC